MANSLTDVINFTPLTHNDHGRKLKESVKKLPLRYAIAQTLSANIIKCE